MANDSTKRPGHHVCAFSHVPGQERAVGRGPFLTIPTPSHQQAHTPGTVFSRFPKSCLFEAVPVGVKLLFFSTVVVLAPIRLATSSHLHRRFVQRQPPRLVHLRCPSAPWRFLRFPRGDLGSHLERLLTLPTCSPLGGPSLSVSASTSLTLTYATAKTTPTAPSPMMWPQATSASAPSPHSPHQLAPFSFHAHACHPWNELPDCLAGSAVAPSATPSPVSSRLS